MKKRYNIYNEHDFEINYISHSVVVTINFFFVFHCHFQQLLYYNHNK